MKKLYIVNLTFALLFLAQRSFAQSPTASIANWKDNAKGCYSIIHDDFGAGNVNGIENYADTIAYNRGVKFTFGAITVDCDANNWNDAKRMISHGHEIINHSHTHRCGIYFADWCTNTWGPDDFDTEIDQSTQLIETHSGNRPRFYIFPYDLWTEDMLTHLKSLNYLGARAGTKNILSDETTDYFKLNFHVFEPGHTLAMLDGAVQDAINEGKWALRELHGVQDGSWGSVPEGTYRSHLDFVKNKMQSKDLWAATVTEVITYQMQRKAYTPTATYNATSQEITITWNNPVINTSDLISPVTVNVDLDGLSGVFNVYQNSKVITEVSQSEGILSFNVYPHQGSITITKGECPGICIIKHPESKVADNGDDIVFEADATSSNTLSFQWQKDNVDLDNATGKSLSLTDVTEADEGNYRVKFSNGTETTFSDAATLTVYTNTPYNGTAHTIPGKIEAEDYDLGGPLAAYYDNTATNLGLANYRNDQVDIETCSDQGSGYNIGYFDPEEWIEYTVNVEQSGNYDFSFRLATETSGALQLFTNKLSIGTITVNATGGWQQYSDASINVVPLEQGIQVFRIKCTSGNFNLNNFTVSHSMATSFIGESDKSIIVARPTVFSDVTRLSLKTDRNSKILIKAVDLQGSTKLEETLMPGEYEFGKTLPSGVYLIYTYFNDSYQVLKLIKL